jgi:hypothetical protein
MTAVSIQLAYKDVAWFNANPTIVLANGQHVHLSDGADEFSDAYVIGNGSSTLINLQWRGVPDLDNTDTFVVPPINGYVVSLGSIPKSIYYAALNGQLLLPSSYSVASNQFTLNRDDGGDLMVVYKY